MGTSQVRIEFGTHRILVWRERRFEPAEFPAALALAEGILERLPPSFVQKRSLSS